MLCPPVKWDENTHGGLIENSTAQKSIITGSSFHNHIMGNKSSLYNAVNYVSRTPFTINNGLLDYILNEGSYLLELSNSNKEKIIHTELTLAIAKAFKNNPFYLNINTDWRGRLYTQSFFISYQAPSPPLAP